MSVTEQHINCWRYNKPLCSTPSWHNTTQHNTNTQCTLHTVSNLFHTTHQLRTPHSSQYAVHVWNYSTGTTQLCNSVFPDNSNKNTHCIWTADGEVIRNNSINYSHAIKTRNELAKIKAHTKTSLHAVPSYTLGQFRTSNCVTRYTQTCAKWKLAYKCGLHVSLKNKKLVLKDVSVAITFKHYMNLQVL